MRSQETSNNQGELQIDTAGGGATIGDDLLHGADAIAEFVFGHRRHRRKVYHLTSHPKHSMPHFKIGSVTCALKSSLRRWIKKQEGLAATK
ncbi:MAG: hypothetical protein H7839_20755 [Magnetococcus sp. YQC-5]